MRYSIFAIFFLSNFTFACLCNNEVAFYIAAKAIENKYPEYKISMESYEVKELDDKWLLLRKEAIYMNNPKEYPRARRLTEGCKIETIFWSK